MNRTPTKVLPAVGRARALDPEEWVRILQGKLGDAAKADPKRRFHTLIDKVYNPRTLMAAWKKVRANRGAAGVDRRTIAEIECIGPQKYLERLSKDLQNGTYKIKGVRRAYVPKADGGERPLGIPTVDDRIVQAAVCLVIEPLFETGFEDCSFGFRPGRSADMARQRIYKLLNWGCEFVVETDIEAFFGTIPHDRLMKAVERRISDSRVLGLIRGWLKAKVHADGVLSEPEAGTPQGGPLSPLLANIYLDQLDKAWRELGMDDKNGPDAKLVRYADDLVILTSKDPMVPYRALEKIVRDLGLGLNYGKTRTLDCREAPFDFLGFTFRRRMGGPNHKYCTRMTPTSKAIQRLKDNVRSHLVYKAVPKSELVKKIQGLNEKTRGWANYYKHTNARRAFVSMQRFIEQSVRKFLRKRRQRSGYGYREYPSEYLYKSLKLYDIRQTGITYVGGL